MKRKIIAAAALCLMAASQLAHAADAVKIGFLVKQAEEPWFQDEWRYAEQAAKDKGFALVKIGVPNGEKMIAAIDNLAAQKAQGFVICAPDVKLGTAVERAARRKDQPPQQRALHRVDTLGIERSGAGRAFALEHGLFDLRQGVAFQSSRRMQRGAGLEP